MTQQETFDIVTRHLLTQGKKSLLGTAGGCMYRAPDGSKCAVGCLIPDERYRPDFEQTAVKYWSYRTEREEPTKVGLLLTELGHDLDLVDRLQYLHDACDPQLWEQKLRELATLKWLEFRWPHE